MRAILIGLMALATGCSGGESVSRAPFTAGGEAGAVSVPFCEQGTTRACLGPGQCPGAQQCEPDALWGPCECADVPGTGGAGGAVPATGGASGAAGEAVAAAVVAGCDPGWLYCANMCVNPLADVTNCGACGVWCDAGTETCVDGVCECAPGFTDCSASGDSYRCADLLTDPNHCGTCQTYCGSGLCFGGICST